MTTFFRWEVFVRIFWFNKHILHTNIVFRQSLAGYVFEELIQIFVDFVFHFFLYFLCWKVIFLHPHCKGFQYLSLCTFFYHDLDILESLNFIALINKTAAIFYVTTVWSCHEVLFIHRECPLEFFNIILRHNYFWYITAESLGKLFLESLFNIISNIPIFAKISWALATDFHEFLIMQIAIFMENSSNFIFGIVGNKMP